MLKHSAQPERAMHQPLPAYSPGSSAPNDELVTRLMALRPGEALTIIGLGHAQLGEVLSRTSSTPRMLRLDLAGAATTAVAIDRILDDLADLATALWPDWDGPEQPERLPRLLPTWRRAAMRFASTGRRPRFPRLARETEIFHLLSVLRGLLLLAQVDALRSERAAPIIAALEWCRRHGAAVVVLLAEEPAPEAPWDRLLYDAVIVQRLVESAARRLILSSHDITSRGSAIERRLRAALRAASDLAGLFEDEVTLQLGALGPAPRVDLLWRDGKVVVELDGPEHERDPNYGADRHRDYELLVAGYLVLRLTNAEVELDLARSLEKVRRVVNLRRGL
jgi:very-short-patch-repair endonuclease